MFYFYNIKNFNKLKNHIYTPILFLDNYTKYYFRVILNFNQAIVDNYTSSTFTKNSLKNVGYSFIINKTIYTNNLNKLVKFNYIYTLSIPKQYLHSFSSLLQVNKSTFILIKPKRSGFKIYNSGVIGFLSKIELKQIMCLLINTRMFSVIKQKFLVIQFSTNFFKLSVKLYYSKKFVNRLLKKKRNTTALNFLFSISTNIKQD